MSEYIPLIAAGVSVAGTGTIGFIITKRNRQHSNDDWIRQKNVSRAVNTNITKKFESRVAKGLDGLPMARTAVTHTIDALLVLQEPTSGAPIK